MNEFDIIYIIWMWVLPALAIMWSVLVPVVWIFIVPKTSKRLMWARFRNSSILAIADDSGWADLVVTTKSIPEGIFETKDHGWRFMPRVQLKKELDPKQAGVSSENTDQTQLAEQIASRKYILKDLGKPFWFCYDGKVAVVNPATLAALQETSRQHNPESYLTKMREFASTQPVQVYTELTKLIEELHETLQKKTSTLTVLDPKIMKTILSKMFNVSQIAALATNREEYGAKLKGHEYGKLIIGGALIIGLVILGIVAISYLMK